jgi:CubicO group peptidase (beta-lactamase class C family)
MRKKLGQGFAVFVLLFSLVGFVQSQTPTHSKANPTVASRAATATSPTAAPEEVGLSSERLERMASAIQKSIDDGRIAGGVSLVARHGKIACFKAVGNADRDAKKPMRTDSIFRICSMSKPLTSVAVMMLYEEGRFTLNQPLSDFLPEFKNMKVLDPPWPQDKTSPPGALVDAKRPITIFHLLTHTSGLTYGGARLSKAYRDAGVTTGLIQQEGTIAEGVKKMASVPLLFQPGDVWEYSLADDVLGRLVEVVSGMPFDKFLEERLFKPLGMKDTCFFLPEEKVARLATAYTYYPEKGLQPILDGQVVKEGEFDSGYSADYPYRGPRTYFSGGGGLCSTAEDYYRFCQMMLNGGELNGVRIISRKSVELMSQNHVQGKRDDGYGLGFGDISEPKQLTELGSVGAYYWGGFYYTTFVIDPKEDLIAIFMGQLHPTGGLNLDSKAIRLAYQAIKD